ncbi:MAG: hypothetical protein MUE53_05425 [Chitinophagales bacterium]|jgi:hypothetical protein|nr:hypothetical protein [Chitinophagales bacterium]
MKKTIIFFVLASVFALSMLHCGKDPCSFRKSSLAGTWKFTSASDENGKATDSIPTCQKTNTIVFTTDSMRNTVCEGRYKYVAETILNKNFLTFGGTRYEVRDYSCTTMNLVIPGTTKNLLYKYTKQK